METSISLEINGKQIAVNSSNLKDIVMGYLKISEENFRGLAVAVNNEIIPKSEWNKVSIKDSDRIEIITATQGG